MENTTVENLISLVRYHSANATICLSQSDHSGFKFHDKLLNTCIRIIGLKYNCQPGIIDSFFVSHYTCIRAACGEGCYAEAVNAHSKALSDLRDELINLEEVL